ncbi:hypothetical protein FQN49_008758, partial [Arthroderma sp. PD_2]
MKMNCLSSVLVPPHHFFFSLLVVSGFSSKALHILQHANSLPTLQLILYLPTLIFLDLVVACIGRVLLCAPGSVAQLLGYSIGSTLAVASLAASAIQFGFYFETGSEIQWSASANFVGDLAAIKLLLSGIRRVSFAGVMIAAVSRLLSPYLHRTTGRWLLVARTFVLRQGSKGLPRFDTSKGAPRSVRSIICVIIVSVSFILLAKRRPAVPYNHLSGAVPLTLLEAFKSPQSIRTYSDNQQAFPFPDLISEKNWKKASGKYPGWTPGKKQSTGAGCEGGAADKCPHGDRTSQIYDPVTDPLKISNLDLDTLAVLRDTFEDNAVEISHIVMVALESTRKDVFPMQPASSFYNAIIQSHEESEKDQ